MKCNGTREKKRFFFRFFSQRPLQLHSIIWQPSEKCYYWSNCSDLVPLKITRSFKHKQLFPFFSVYVYIGQLRYIWIVRYIQTEDNGNVLWVSWFRSSGLCSSSGNFRERRDKRMATAKILRGWNTKMSCTREMITDNNHLFDFSFPQAMLYRMVTTPDARLLRKARA